MKCTISCSLYEFRIEGTLSECVNLIRENKLTADILRNGRGIRHYIDGVRIYPRSFEDYEKIALEIENLKKKVF